MSLFPSLRSVSAVHNTVPLVLLPHNVSAASLLTHSETDGVRRTTNVLLISTMILPL